MKLLLDTHILLWALENNPKLTNNYRSLISDTENEKWVSYFSFMEIAVKLKIGKLPGSISDVSQLIEQSIKDGFLLMPVSDNQISAYNNIPLYPEHRDPFDRFIIGVANQENCTILTVDEKFLLYQDMVNIVIR